MSVKLTNNEPFKASNDGIRQLAVVVGTGDATLEAKAGDSWVAVTDGNVAADGIISFHAVSDQVFRVTLTGTAEAWLAG